ncbi:ABC transporter permease [Paenibacillus lautus]|uniref:ABC transporter permease n=1 Tax=Paenibacillus lautus TaxID=1401 RepID=UPI001C0FD7E2|nr:ABC transporter permease subunit [Paenibacillus lautus]MBU5348313.1 ABC transporter permease subunit [Paenibacillus lautus]
MLVPGIILVLIFNYLPMAGLVLAFQNFKPWLGVTGSEWVGMEHFRDLFSRKDSLQVIWNTFIIAGMKMIVGLVVPVVFAILLNEIRQMSIKRTVQTLVYLPHFMSWVILGGILLDLLSSRGLVNDVILPMFNIGPVPFLTDGDWFRFTVISSDTWKEFGFSAIVFLASLAGINPALYEAAEVDGATRFKQTLHITLPAMVPIIVVVGTLSLGSILNAGFDQIFNLYNVLVYDKGDIIDTYVYRVGILNSQFSFASAVGLFKSAIGFVLIVIAYRLAYKYANYRIF